MLYIFYVSYVRKSLITGLKQHIHNDVQKLYFLYNFNIT